MRGLFNEILIRPLFNLLIFLYDTVTFTDLGVAIILLTLLIRLVLYPLSQKAIRSQKELIKIQPEIKEIQEKYKDNKEEQVKKVMAVYKERKINPFSGCVPILLQLPILIALYSVFSAGFSDDSLNNLLYNFTPRPEHINYIFLGVVDISQNNIVIAIIAAAAQFYQSKMVLDQQKSSRSQQKGATEDMSSAITKQMTYVMPVVTLVIASTFNAGLALYWATTTLFSVAQQWYVFKRKEK